MILSSLFRLAIAASAAFICNLSTAGTPPPAQDAKGLSDPPNLKRYTGSVLLYRDDAAYDEVKLPTATPVERDNQLSAPRTLNRAGQRTTLQYLTPAGRSPLEVLRNYQQDLKAAGFDTAWECAADSCGASEINLYNYGLGKLLMPPNYASKIGDNSPAACATGAYVKDVRYAVLDNKTTGASVAIMTWIPGDSSVYCEEKEFQKRSSVWLVRVEPKAREQSMQALSSSEMSKSLDAAGKVAIYGILFDTNKADIQAASKPSLDQIGALMKERPKLKLHVVGHTDNVGGFDANLALSRRRADSVVGALARDYGVAPARLTGNGVANLAPVQSNADEAGRAKNRRVELVLQ